jgi:hypothetical protein
MVYLLLGIFNIYIPLIYSKGGKNAVRRLQEAINRKEKGTLFLFNRELSYIKVTNLNRDKIQELFNPVQSLYSL